MWSDTPWRAQKLAALGTLPDYDYAIGTGYSLIPAARYTQGFDQHDRAQENVFAAIDKMAPNVPYDPRGLYKPHENLEGGYIFYSSDEALLDYAPFLVNRKMFSTNQLTKRSMASVHSDRGYDLPMSAARGVRLDSNSYKQEPLNFQVFRLIGAAQQQTQTAQYSLPK